MDTSKATQYAAPLVRYGMAAVFLLFGILQWTAPATFFGYLPSWVTFIDANTLVLLNGTFDFLLGALLAIGVFTRITALIAAVHVFGIAITIGWNDVAIRDIGIACACASIAFQGPDQFCYDGRSRNSKKKQ